MIDLGLRSGNKWACYNVGANMPEDNGGYFAWGETSEKDEYDGYTYIGCVKHNMSIEQFVMNIGNDISGTEYDVAHVQWGDKWRMPTSNQYNEMVSACNWSWTTLNGIYGCKFVSKKNGASIFLPAAGWKRSYRSNYKNPLSYTTYFTGLGTNVGSWLSTRHGNSNQFASSINLWDDSWESWYVHGYYDASHGLTVRPVWVVESK